MQFIFSLRLQDATIPNKLELCDFDISECQGQSDHH